MMTNDYFHQGYSMIVHPTFSQRQDAMESALETAKLTQTERFVVCHGGMYHIRLTHTPGPLANWFARIMPDGTVIEGF